MRATNVAVRAGGGSRLRGMARSRFAGLVLGVALASSAGGCHEPAPLVVAPPVVVALPPLAPSAPPAVECPPSSPVGKVLDISPFSMLIDHACDDDPSSEGALCSIGGGGGSNIYVGDLRSEPRFARGAVELAPGEVAVTNGKTIIRTPAGNQGDYHDADVQAGLVRDGVKKIVPIVNERECNDWFVGKPLHRGQGDALEMTFRYSCGDPIARSFAVDVTVELVDGEWHWRALGVPRLID
jgi:hypothetical protein